MTVLSRGKNKVWATPFEKVLSDTRKTNTSSTLEKTAVAVYGRPSTTHST